MCSSDLSEQYYIRLPYISKGIPVGVLGQQASSGVQREGACKVEATGYLELTIVFVTLIFSVISIVGSVVFRLHYHRKIDLEYLGWGILLGTVWNITKSHAGRVLFHDSPVVVDIAFFVMLLLPLPFLFYMDEV